MTDEIIVNCPDLESVTKMNQNPQIWIALIKEWNLDFFLNPIVWYNDKG
jgi:hypothetical protein